MTISPSPSAPLVAVVGATGLQGGSLVAALAGSSKPYRVRGFTRDASKPAAEALKARGVEVVAANFVLGNEAAARSAFEGADYAFLVTNFWEHFDLDREIAEGRLLIDAARAAPSMRGIIWSGLLSPREVSNGKYTSMLHYEGKATITKYGLAVTAGTPVGFVVVPAAFYMANFLATVDALRMVRPVAGKPGEFRIEWDMKKDRKMELIDVEKDYGEFVVRRVIEPEVFPHGQEVNTRGEALTPEEIAKAISQGTGKNVVYNEITPEEWKRRLLEGGVPELLAEDTIQTFAYFSEFGVYAHKSLASAEGIRLHTFAEFVQRSNWDEVFA
ncbi:NmrA domain-containing protein [Mycena indigotica]|uniref:NmrA domain-containing protein n=1 Tax=Mycena indigotica TaxID=2126181 RepID=A0A8H6W0K3_9AGAR|nr:NmrA domain-containing protein [Mycena indigotica]KAF7298621.1 NmrA domain-containing protein [Mycena indigotica]